MGAPAYGPGQGFGRARLEHVGGPAGRAGAGRGPRGGAGAAGATPGPGGRPATGKSGGRSRRPPVGGTARGETTRDTERGYGRSRAATPRDARNERGPLRPSLRADPVVLPVEAREAGRRRGRGTDHVLECAPRPRRRHEAQLRGFLAVGDRAERLPRPLARRAEPPAGVGPGAGGPVGARGARDGRSAARPASRCIGAAAGATAPRVRAARMAGPLLRRNRERALGLRGGGRLARVPRTPDAGRDTR